MNKHHMPQLLTKVIAGLLCLVFFALFLVNANYSYGHLYGKSADLYLKQWQANGQAPSFQQWQQALAQAHQANSTQANNPLHLKRLGKLHELAGDFNQTPATTKQQHYETAEDYYSQTIQARSIWSWDWFNVFKIKTKLNTIDQQAIDALAMTIKRDPNNYDLLINVISTSMPNMHIPEINKIVLNAINHVLKNATAKSHERLLSIYKAYGREKQLCLYIQVEKIRSTGLSQCSKILNSANTK